MYELFQHFFISLLQSFSDGNHFCIQKYYSIQILLGTLCGYYMTCMQFDSPQLKQTQYNKHNNLFSCQFSILIESCSPILTPGFIETTNLKLLFKNNTCFTFNPKFAIDLSLHMTTGSRIF